MKWFDCLKISLVSVVFLLIPASCMSQSSVTEPFTFVQVCDPQLGWGYGYENDLNSFKEAVKHINGLQPDLVVICGDMVDNFNDSSVSDFIEAQNGLTMPSYCSPGNHDVGNEPTVSRLERYRQAFGDDYFSFEHKGYTFVIVNAPLWKAPVAGETEKQDTWLRETLAAAHAKNSPIFVVGHHPLYLTNPDEPEEYYNLPPDTRSELLSMFVEYGVVAALGGHRHLLVINEYKGIQLVHGETTCRHFDNSPLGFRLWHVESPTSIWHEFRPLVAEIPSVDFNDDGIVDISDISIMVEHWHEDYALCDVAPSPFGDGIVDIQDLTYLSEHLFEDYRVMAQWKLDEAEGDICYDSKSLTDGIVHGSPTWQPDGGQVDGALLFDGVDDYISTDYVLDPADAPFSVFAWIKGGAPGQIIIAQTGNPWGANWLCADSSEGSLKTELKGTNRWSQSLTSEIIITDGNWHHIGLTWDGSNRTLYVDDVAVITDTQKSLGSSSEGLHIGAAYNLDTGKFWSGLIDDVRIFNRATTP
jgi:hypothetical protein